MGIAYGVTTNFQATKGIVQDGLVLNVDPAVASSYPKSGTNWTDIKNNLTGTLTNGASFDKSNGGTIITDGTDDYVTFGDESSLNLQNLTMSCWFKFTGLGSSPDAGIFGKIHSSTGYKGYMFWYGGGHARFYARGATRISYAMSSNQWCSLVGTYDSTTFKYYFNGSLVGSSTQTVTIDASSQDFYIGNYGHANRTIGGEFGPVHLYNRALTAAEVSRNYNVMRHRFGI